MTRLYLKILTEKLIYLKGVIYIFTSLFVILRPVRRPNNSEAKYMSHIIVRNFIVINKSEPNNKDTIALYCQNLKRDSY